LAGTIIADRIQLDNLTDTFKIVSNTNVDIITANSSGILTGVADGTVTNAKLNLAANASAIKTALNASGDAGIYACRAWVNFDGTTNTGGNCDIRASGNVSSITDNGTGDYTVNFTTAMPDANYSYVGTASRTGAEGAQRTVGFVEGNTYSTTAIRISVEATTDGSQKDNAVVCVAIFR
jgi:hypothetical protein